MSKLLDDVGLIDRIVDARRDANFVQDAGLTKDRAAGHFHRHLSDHVERLKARQR
jgi:hypothetical protein